MTEFEPQISGIWSDQSVDVDTAQVVKLPTR